MIEQFGNNERVQEILATILKGSSVESALEGIQQAAELGPEAATYIANALNLHAADEIAKGWSTSPRAVMQQLRTHYDEAGAAEIYDGMGGMLSFVAQYAENPGSLAKCYAEATAALTEAPTTLEAKEALFLKSVEAANALIDKEPTEEDIAEIKTQVGQITNADEIFAMVSGLGPKLRKAVVVAMAKDLTKVDAEDVRAFDRLAEAVRDGNESAIQAINSLDRVIQLIAMYSEEKYQIVNFYGDEVAKLSDADYNIPENICNAFKKAAERTIAQERAATAKPNPWKKGM